MAPAIAELNSLIIFIKQALIDDDDDYSKIVEKITINKPFL